MLFSTITILVGLLGGGDESTSIPFTLDGQVMRATVEPRSLRSKDFNVVVQGSKGIEYREYPCRTLRGTIVDDDAFDVFGIDGDDGISLTIMERASGRLWSVTHPGATAEEISPPDDLVCGNDFEDLAVLPDDGGVGSGGLAGGSCLRIAQIAIDCDYAFLANDFGGNVQAAIDDVEDCMNLVEALYAMHVGVTYEITAIVIRDDSGTDPYAPYQALGDMLGVMGDEWNGSGSMSHIETDIVHMITGQPAVDGYLGLAYVGAVCSSYRFGTSRCTCEGVVAHELGHNWGAGHCADTDNCNAMCGACMAIGPNDVTTMLAHRDSRACLDVGSAWDDPIPPDALADRVVTESDVVVDIDVLANDHDFSCDTLSISNWDATSQAGGTVELALSGGNEVLRYTPPALFFGNDSFSYTVLDLEGFTDTTSVSITVITLGDIRVGSYCPQQYNTDSIQDAISFYGGGIDQVIFIAPGTYTERIVIDRPVVIQAETVAAETIIDAQSNGPAVEFASSFTGIVELSGLTIAKGSAANGGAFLVDGPVLIMHDCRLVGNWADDAGGAVLIESGTASFNGCAFWSNDSGGSGPAVVNVGGTCLLYQCDLTGQGSSGTAVHTQSGTTRLWQSVLCGNSGGNIDGPWQDLGENEISETCDCTPGSFNHPEDCDDDGVHDRCEIAAGTLTDENANGTADTCEAPPTLLAQWSSIECNGNDHWYELVPVPSGITWLSARSAAVNRGGQLASLAEQAESNWVFGAIASNESGWNISPDGVAEGPWIGLFQSSSSGWAWLDSSPYSWSNWAPGEPSGNGDYCWLWGPGNNGFPVDTWDDIPNMNAPGYIVEWQTPEDCNGNGSPDVRDIALGTSLDDDGDGVPDECVPECPADLDGNGTVDGADLAHLLGFWSIDGDADLDGNGVIDGADLAILLGAWGDC